MMERLQKILSAAGLMSRRAAEACISEGRVTVNGQQAKLGNRADAERDTILVDGRKLPPAGKKLYIMLNKPRGYVTTLKDEKGRKSVADLVQDLDGRVYPVGRLDNNTEGLLLITNDGTLMNGLLHPKYEVEKTYIARIMGEPDEVTLDRLRQGIRLEDGMTAPAKVRLLEQGGGQSRVEIAIHEGRNRQVRRMFAAIGSDVRALKRVKFATLTLTGVKRGHYRPLTDAEVAELYRIAGLEQS